MSKSSFELNYKTSGFPDVGLCPKHTTNAIPPSVVAELVGELSWGLGGKDVDVTSVFNVSDGCKGECLCAVLLRRFF